MKKIEILLIILFLPLFIFDYLETKVSFYIPLIIFIAAQGLIWINFSSKKYDFSKSIFFSMLFSIEFSDLCQGNTKSVIMGISMVQMLIFIYLIYRDYVKNN